MGLLVVAGMLWVASALLYLRPETVVVARPINDSQAVQSTRIERISAAGYRLYCGIGFVVGACLLEVALWPVRRGSE